MDGGGEARNRLNGSLFVAAVLAAFYSFGTFGLLNLFGLRTAGQILSAWLLVLVLAVSALRVRTVTVVAAGLFFGTYALGGIIRAGIWGYCLEAAMALGLWVIISAVPHQHIRSAARTLVVSTVILVTSLTIAYVFYLVHPDWILSANFNIYGSTTGSARATPGFVLDYLSFTSGDGFTAAGRVLPRLKGYSNEPSATIVHYLAPSLVALLLGGRYRLFAIFILLVNLIAIASVTSYVVIAGGLLIVVAFHLPRRIALIGLAAGLAAVVMLLLDASALTQFQVSVGQRAIDLAGFDLLSRKVDSIVVRQEGLAAGLQRVVSAPLGWSGSNDIAGGGALMSVSAFSGWLGVGILAWWCVRFGRVALNDFKQAPSLMRRVAPATCVALLFVALLVSGYGWNRVPGVIMLALIYRLLADDGVRSRPVAAGAGAAGARP